MAWSRRSPRASATPSTRTPPPSAWRLALNWAPTDAILLIASTSRGAKAGATPINAANISTQNAPAKQEILQAYEVWIKAGLFERRVQANILAFCYDYEDKQLSVYFADPIYTALARLRGPTG